MAREHRPAAAGANDRVTTLRQLRDCPEIFAELQTLEQEGAGELAIQQRLRKQFPDAVVRAVVTLQELRRRAEPKFSRAAQMWFDRQGFEQATGETVAIHKAHRFTRPTWDLCCGIGADAIAIAANVAVTAVDHDEATLLQAEWNAHVYGVQDRFTPLLADVTTVDPGDDLIHIDPDRRAGNRGRAVRLEDYQPGPEFLDRMIAQRSGGAIKLSPASNFGGKFSGCEIELISLHGECKEATVWFGELAGEAPFRATVLPQGATLAGDPFDFDPVIDPLGRYIYDPDPAIVRAGLVDALAVEVSLSRLDDAEEYLTSDTLVKTPFARAFEVLDVVPFKDKALRGYFRAASFGQLEIKCRHVPVDASALRRKLRLDGSDAGVLIVARESGKARGVVCRRCD
ncbi:RNA cap guanine-N2 methyltransferase [Maioricimonas rarisocia]|uniref:RNA cap guanine-N2 methyltransferase n=1 Tax=Maioricimonas rarisocia TaxID=2528026 RepID=A0A517Z739_9PLAN|nr:hypothetical protein [Maioricimonas rarisocia]QDU38308.1 RNA cap guanine-N2 methyltransferase [Maioricimonas rarisocia]